MASARSVPICLTCGSLNPALEEFEQCLLRLVQAITAISHQIFETGSMVTDHLPFFESTDDFRTNVRASTYRRRVPKNLSRLFDRGHDAFVFRSLLQRHLVSVLASKSDRANERARPGAKIFRAEVTAHHFLDVLVDMARRYLHRFAVAIYKLEDVKAWKLHRRANHARYLSIA